MNCELHIMTSRFSNYLAILTEGVNLAGRTQSYGVEFACRDRSKDNTFISIDDFGKLLALLFAVAKLSDRNTINTSVRRANNKITHPYSPYPQE